MVHGGFFFSLREIWRGSAQHNDIGLGKALHHAIESGDLKDQEIIVVGHSLGGAQASIAADHIALAYNARVQLTTAGGPRAFHRTYAGKLMCAVAAKSTGHFDLDTPSTTIVSTPLSKCRGANWIQKALVQINAEVYADFGAVRTTTATIKPGTLAVQRWVNTGDPIPALAFHHALQLKHFGRAILIDKTLGAYSYTYKRNIDYTPLLTASPMKHMTGTYMGRLFQYKKPTLGTMAMSVVACDVIDTV